MDKEAWLVRGVGVGTQSRVRISASSSKPSNRLNDGARLPAQAPPSQNLCIEARERGKSNVSCIRRPLMIMSVLMLMMHVG